MAVVDLEPLPRQALKVLRVSAILSALLLTSAASASLAVALDLEALVHQSDAIVVGRVVAQQSRWDGDRIVTDVLVEVAETLHGTSPPDRMLQVVRLGGSIGELGMRVEGEPNFEGGGQYLLFLRRWRGLYRPVGMSQGVMRVRVEGGAPMVQPGGSGLSLVTRPGGPPAFGALRGPRPLESLRERIRALASD